MRKNSANPTEPQQTVAAESSSAKTKVTDRNWRPLILIGAIMFLAAFVRIAFSVSLSAGSDFALSGGTEASNNLRFVESIVADGKFRFTDNYLNYPYGTLVVVPILFDLVMALFGMIFHLFISDATTASSLALALSGPVFGILAVIPMYFVGKEMFSSKLAGYLSALFLALCPVFVEESVFSNGSGMSFALFFFLFGIYFLIKALKNLNEAVSAYKIAIIAGVFVMVAMLSWTDIRNVAIPFVVVMVAQVLIDRFKGKDPRPAATVYTMVAAIGFIIPMVAYIIAGYWNALVSGPMVFTVLAIGFTTAYAWTQSKPWILTLPIISAVCIVILGIVAIISPELCNCIFHGNLYYDSVYWASLGKQALNLSKLTLYYGVVTYWFVFLLCLYMVFRFLRNASSALYVFTLVWLFTMTLTLGHNAMEAAFAAPVFALGFAAVCKTVLAHVDFKAYFAGIKTSVGKVRFKRIISPIPLITILVAVFLVAAPNMMQVIDAGISNNDVSDYNEQASKVTGNDQFGSLGYYIKTDDSWAVRNALKNCNGTGGAFVTWMNYSDDVKVYGNAKCFTDMYGNGTAAASNILLSNGVNGSSMAALLVTAILKTGMNDDVRNALSVSGFSAEDIALIGNVLDSTGTVYEGKTVRSIVTTDYKTYGAVDPSISDFNVSYLFLENYIASNYHSYDITSAYDRLGLRAPYIMVTGDMMPFFYGYASVFDEMALLNGYSVNNSYGTVSKFTSFGYYAYYYGVYDFTQAMYDTMLYRTYIGMTPAEAGYSSLYEYILALSNADVSVQMHPGYGLSNFEVAYWKVMYNPSPNATSDSDGWKEYDAREAIALQATSGGRINYISGLPLILRYVPNSTGNVVSGSVTDASSAGIADIRVMAMDTNGVARAVTHTSEDGSFKLFVSDVDSTTLVYYAGAGIASNGGVIIGTTSASAPGLTNVDVTANITLMMSDGAGPIPVDDYTVKLTNKVTEEALEDNVFTDIPFGEYTVVIKSGDNEIANTSLTINGDGTYVVSLKSYTYKVNVKDIYRNAIPAGVDVTLSGDFERTVATDADGTATFANIPKGTYDVKVAGYYTQKDKITVSSNSSRDVTAYKANTYTVTAPAAGVVVSIVGDAYSTSKVFKTVTEEVVLPVSAFSDTVYTVSCIYNNKYYCADTAAATVTLAENDLVTLTGTLKNHDGTAVAGTVTFVSGSMKFTYTAAADGTYRAYLPAKNFTVYATNSDDAYIGNLDLTSAGAAPTQDIAMQEADKVSSSTVYWSSIYYSYVKISATINSTYTIPMMTNNGSFSFYLPRGMGASVSIALDGTTFQDITAKTVEPTHSSDTALTSFQLTSNSTNVTVNNDLSSDFDDIDLSIAGTTHKVSEWASAEKFDVNSNSKSIVLGSSSQKYYFSGSHYFSPETVISSIDLSTLLNGSTAADITYNMVKVADNTDEYTVKVYYSDSGYTTVTGTDEVRIAEKAATYYVVISKNDNTKIFYTTFSGDNTGLTVASCVDATLLSGYVGATMNGKIVFNDGTDDVEAKVTDGNYSVLLKRGTPYDVTLRENTGGAEYSMDYSALTLSGETATFNFNLEQSPVSVQVTPTVTYDGAIAEVTYTIPAGQIRNTTDSIETFSFTVGSGWKSYEFTVGGNVADGFSVAPNAAFDSDIVFTGYFNANLYRLGTEDLSVKFTGGTDSVVVSYGSIGGNAGLVYVNKVSDVVGDNTYEYTYEIVNTGSSVQTVGYDLTGTSDRTGWYVFIKKADSRGTFIEADTGAMSGSVGFLPGTTTFSVVFMKTDGTAVSIPSLKVAFSNTDLTTATPDEISVSAGQAVSETSSEDAVVSATSMSASGRGVVNDRGNVPVIVWVMAALVILIFIMIFWMASKRGVFVRKK